MGFAMPPKSLIKELTRAVARMTGRKWEDAAVIVTEMCRELCRDTEAVTAFHCRYFVRRKFGDHKLKLSGEIMGGFQEADFYVDGYNVQGWQFTEAPQDEA